MASLFTPPKDKSVIHVLDSGAGSGMLAAALVEKLQKCSWLHEIHLTCYEKDENILPLLRKTMDLLSINSKITLKYTLRRDYILEEEETKAESKKYDMIIGNPPYMKVSPLSGEAKAIRRVCNSLPNIYSIFVVKSLSELSTKGELVYIIPRSWTSGTYFKNFRNFLHKYSTIKHIHLFETRHSNFLLDSVLQETMILKLCKNGKKSRSIAVSTSLNCEDYKYVRSYNVPYNHVVSGVEGQYIQIVRNEEDDAVIRAISSWHNSLKKMGIPMKTGQVVQFRTRGKFAKIPLQNQIIPLLCAHHIRDGRVDLKERGDNLYLDKIDKDFSMVRQAYLLLRRFSAKEEKKRLQCGLFLPDEFPWLDCVCLDNKVNYIAGFSYEKIDLLRGLYIIYQSSFYDKFFRIISGSTQVNSTEMNNAPLPDNQAIKILGTLHGSHSPSTVSACDELLRMVCKIDV